MGLRLFAVMGLLLLLLASGSAQSPSTTDPEAKSGGVPFGGLVADGPPQCPRGAILKFWGYMEDGAVWSAVYQCV